MCDCGSTPSCNITAITKGEKGDKGDAGGSYNSDFVIYLALLSQVGTAAPTVKILKNTLGGTVVWTRSSTGTYVGTLLGVFTLDKTVVFTGNDREAESSCVANVSADYVSLYTLDPSIGTVADDLLNNTPIEIRVYA